MPGPSRLGLGADPNLRAAFRDPPMAAQAVFRLALEAMSRPAEFRPAPLAGLFAAGPPMPPVLAALLLTLADHLTPVWLSDSLKGAAGYLAFHTGAPATSDPGRAVFAAAASIAEMPRLADLPPGLERYPDTSATVLLAAGPTPAGTGPEIWASGPGLQSPRLFGAAGLGRRFVGDWAANRSGYPLGVDMLICGPDSLAGLPRSTDLSLERPAADGGPDFPERPDPDDPAL